MQSVDQIENNKKELTPPANPVKPGKGFSANETGESGSGSGSGPGFDNGGNDTRDVDHPDSDDHGHTNDGAR